MDTLAKRLTFLLDELGLKQRRIAEIAGVTHTSVNRWANGSTTNPQEDELQKVADVLRTTTTWLRTGIGPMHPNQSDHAIETSNFYALDTLSEGADVLVIGQALQAMLKTLPPRGISLEDPRLAQIFQALIRRSRESGESPIEEWVLEELIKPMG